MQQTSSSAASSTLRRKRSKGTIVAYGKEAATAEASELTSESHSAAAAGSATSSTVNNTQPQHAADTSPPPSKPCHSARLALMCSQNAIRLGARTQLQLCPPGRVRRELQAFLRQRARGRPSRRSVTDTGGYFGLDKLLGSETLEEYDMQEEEYLLSSNTFDDESDEEASSGDEDEMCDFDDLFSEESPQLDDPERYLNLREPLFISAGSESALSNPNGAPMTSMGAGQPSKLPFNFRKIRFFDSVTAEDSTLARSYLRKETRRSKRRSAVMLTRHLRKAQIEEKKRRRRERGERTSDLDEADVETPEERALLNGGVEPYKAAMTPAAAAALLLESLSGNPIESVEGMSKCYDGIVAAGLAILEAQPGDPTSPPNAETKSRALRSEIMSALTPLLITSLEQPSGEVILTLAKLRRMCGTPRYQRRFVQRVAPRLIRPPHGAMWCLRHVNDMEAILAAAELIFDSAFEVFSKGWYERGQLLLADTKRAETLNAAAKQLRSLSSEPSDGLALGLHGHGNRRRGRITTARTSDGGGHGENLAEWEVIAVDRQIRMSISNVLSLDWTRTSLHSDIPKPHNRRATVSTMKRISALPQTSSSEMSPKSISSSSPRSPARTMFKTPQSPPHLPVSSSPNATDAIENVFGPSFAGQSTFSRERSISPPPQGTSPPSIQRSNSREGDSKTPMTPPRSPKSPVRPPVSEGARQPDSVPVLAPLSPKRGKFGVGQKETVGSTTPTSQMNNSTPLSPSASSVGTSGSGEIFSYKPAPSAASSVSGSGSTSHYRILTSTAAERKRLVAACRALRAQIQRFEDAFIQLHGRPPKGAVERAPLATTYAQYREWKRAIRADAACRIQALFRGASTRWKLLRTDDQRVTRIILNRAGRAKSSESIINQISIPVEIGQADQERSPSVAIAPASASESFSGHGQTLAPQWASKIVRRRSADRDALPTAAASKQYPLPPHSSQPSSVSDTNSLSLSELQARKRDLKQQLKQYDMNFARKHGRMPVKAEKEPIRHLYESYNALKSQISQMEREGRQFYTPPAESPVPSPIPQRTVSPSSGSDSAGEESPARASPLPTRSTKRKVPKAASPPIVSTPAPTQDLASLKAEKSQLHQMLRAYEKDFFRDHKRQVSSFADIRPVASQYRRYKEIKKAIAAFQQGDKA